MSNGRRMLSPNSWEFFLIENTIYLFIFLFFWREYNIMMLSIFN